MADDYLSDREQEEALRQWWHENWRWIIGGIVLGLALLAGWRYWQTHRAERAGQAFELYRNYQSATGDSEKKESALSRLIDEYPASPYALQARLLEAKTFADEGKYDEAAGQLQAIVDRAEDEQLKQIARLRLARLLIQQDRHDDALKLLDPETAGAFAAQVREVRGDALFAKGDREAARAEYASALASNAEAQRDRSMLEMKLQQTGGEPSSSTTEGQP